MKDDIYDWLNRVVKELEHWAGEWARAIEEWMKEVGRVVSLQTTAIRELEERVARLEAKSVRPIGTENRITINHPDAIPDGMTAADFDTLRRARLL